MASEAAAGCMVCACRWASGSATPPCTEVIVSAQSQRDALHDLLARYAALRAGDHSTTESDTSYSPDLLGLGTKISRPARRLISPPSSCGTPDSRQRRSSGCSMM